VAAVSDRDIPSTVQIVWSIPKRVFPPLDKSGRSGHEWDEAAVGLLV
jgi:hypothetical protein